MHIGTALRPSGVSDRMVPEGEAVRRLLQRAVGFDATLTRLLTPLGRDAGAAATPPPAFPPPEPRAPKDDPEARKQQRRDAVAQSRQLGVWWLDRMAAADEPFPERMAWFWHGHFATSAQKVREPQLMSVQNETLRRLGRGDFRALTGWRVDLRSGTAQLRPDAHDAEPKTVLGTTADCDAAGLADLLVTNPPRRGSWPGGSGAGSSPTHHRTPPPWTP